MNFLTRLLRHGRMKAFPTVFEAVIADLSQEEHAEGLVSAVEYCMGLWDKGESGRYYASALAGTSDLSNADAEGLYFRIEDLYLKASHERISKVDWQAIAQRNGEAIAHGYKQLAERRFKHQAAGYGVLMVKLLAQFQSVPAPTLLNISRQFTDALPSVRTISERRRREIEAMPGVSRIAWTAETVAFVVNTASIIVQGLKISSAD